MEFTCNEAWNLFRGQYPLDFQLHDSFSCFYLSKKSESRRVKRYNDSSITSVKLYFYYITNLIILYFIKLLITLIHIIYLDIWYLNTNTLFMFVMERTILFKYLKFYLDVWDLKIVNLKIILLDHRIIWHLKHNKQYYKKF